VFAKLHPTKNFPYISLLVLASFAIVFSMTLPIKKIIPAILAMRILVQFIGQSIGLIALTKRKGIHFFPWKMPLYPIPIILAIIMWGYIFYSTEWMMMSYGIGVLFVGMMVYYIKEKLV
jgi:amino acid transporter